jgi:hypothetical protein
VEPFDDRLLDDEDALAGVDDVLRGLASWGADVRRAASALAGGVPPIASRPRAVVAAGPDGRLLRAVLEQVCPVPFVAWPAEGLPGWAGPLDLVVVPASRRPGSDPREAMLVGAVGEAARRGCLSLVAAPPDSSVARAASGRDTTLLPVSARDPLTVATPLLAVLHQWGLGPDVDAEEVADALDTVAGRCGPAQQMPDNPAKETAIALADALPVVHGGSTLAARAARRVSEAIRAAAGVPAVAGDEHQVISLLAAAPPRDPFADPYADGPRRAHPTVLHMDDGHGGSDRVLAVARARDIPVVDVRGDTGSDLARFATMLATGRYAATYLGLGLGRTAATADQVP